VIQNAVSVTIGKNRLNVEIAFHIALKTRFGQLKNLSNAAVLSRIGHILIHWGYLYASIIIKECCMKIMILLPLLESILISTLPLVLRAFAINKNLLRMDMYHIILQESNFVLHLQWISQRRGKCSWRC